MMRLMKAVGRVLVGSNYSHGCVENHHREVLGKIAATGAAAVGVTIAVIDGAVAVIRKKPSNTKPILAASATFTMLAAVLISRTTTPIRRHRHVRRRGHGYHYN